MKKSFLSVKGGEKEKKEKKGGERKRLKILKNYGNVAFSGEIGVDKTSKRHFEYANRSNIRPVEYRFNETVTPNDNPIPPDNTSLRVLYRTYIHTCQINVLVSVKCIASDSFCTVYRRDNFDRGAFHV